MRPHAHPADQRQTQNYELITQHYLNYILIRSLAYTNDRTLLERIAVYTLITTCLLMDRLRRKGDLGIVIDTMVCIVGNDQRGDLRSEIADLRFGEAPLAFVLDDPMCEVAGAINGVGRFGRQLLVLHHVEGLDGRVLAEVYATSPGRIEKAIAKAEREFAEILSGRRSWCNGVRPDVRSVLNGLVACLDGEWTKEIADAAQDYLTRYKPEF